jgi:small subunit ribosomal protein S6
LQGYEIVTIVDPQIADEDVPKTSEKINEFITSRGGSIARVQRWGRRRLAYPLQRHTEAHYLLTTFALEPQHASELEADLVLAQEVLKHMVIKVDEAEFQKAADEPPKPAAVVTQAKPAESAAPAEAPVAEGAAPTEAAAAEAPAAEPPAEVASEPATAEESGGAEEPTAEAAEQPESEVKGEP